GSAGIFRLAAFFLSWLARRLAPRGKPGVLDMGSMINQGKWAVLTAALFMACQAINEWVFSHLEFVRGINWIYLPAGVRLVCTLLFGAAGAVGLLVASWITCFFYLFPDDVGRSLVAGVIATLAPYLAYRWAREALELRSDL